jgi:hypothetical protein
MGAQKTLNGTSLVQHGAPVKAIINKLTADPWIKNRSENRRFGQINIKLSHAKELSENLKFIEECLEEGLLGLALEIAEEQSIAFKHSASLLVKIMLRELTDHLKSPIKKSSQTMALNTLKTLISTRCQTLN